MAKQKTAKAMVMQTRYRSRVERDKTKFSRNQKHKRGNLKEEAPLDDTEED